MNRILSIPKIKIVVISAAVIVTLTVTVVAVACIKASMPDREEIYTDAMVSVSESDTIATIED